MTAGRRWRAGLLAVLSVLAGVSGCDGSGRSTADVGSIAECAGDCFVNGQQLLTEDVQRILGQAVAEAEARNTPATIAIVDRVGNVLAVYRMTGANPDGVVIASTAAGGSSIDGGLEGIRLPGAADTLAAIAKAVTGAYLSSEGNAFTTRTANQIVQEHFNPGELNQPGGPLSGVQFSQLACSDITRSAADGSVGPKRSPLGLAADPGGLPLFKQGVPVGGIGVIADGRYSLDPLILDRDEDVDEVIALAGSFGFAAPDLRRADRITVEGKTLRFTDASLADVASPGNAVSLSTAGSLVAVAGYTDGTVRAGVAYGAAASGIRPDTGVFADLSGYVLVDAADAPRFPPRAGSEAANALTQPEVEQLMRQGLALAASARAQIRRPLNSAAQVSISVVDTRGEILGIVRTADAPIFGIDVAVQKARTAAFFSGTSAGGVLASLPDAQYLNSDLTPSRRVSLAGYLAAGRAFLTSPTLWDDGQIAFSSRSVGNLSRAHFPDGLVGREPGPLAKPAGEWSPFSTGLQLDLAFNAIIRHLAFAAGLTATDIGDRCLGIDAAGNDVDTGRQLANGQQIFSGGVPIYRGETLVGAIGVSGDGIDQDDMIAFLSVHRTSQALNAAINLPPVLRRSDQLTPQGIHLRFVQCPQAPLIGEAVHNLCEGK